MKKTLGHRKHRRSSLNIQRLGGILSPKTVDQASAYRSKVKKGVYGLVGMHPPFPRGGNKTFFNQ